MTIWVGSRSGCHLHASREVVKRQIYLRRFSLGSAFVMDGQGRPGQQKVVMGLLGPDWQRRGAANQSKTAGARDRIESRSRIVASL